MHEVQREDRFVLPLAVLGAAMEFRYSGVGASGLDRPDTTEEEKRLASEAIEWLRSKRDEPKHPKRKE